MTRTHEQLEDFFKLRMYTLYDEVLTDIILILLNEQFRISDKLQRINDLIDQKVPIMKSVVKMSVSL